MEGIELGEYGGLGVGVDHERPVASPAARTGLLHALGLGAGGAQASVFQFSDLAGGYRLASADDAGARNVTEARCGADCVKNMKGVSEAEAKAACDKAHAEGKCGSPKEKKEGKCGEAKCGGKK